MGVWTVLCSTMIQLLMLKSSALSILHFSFSIFESLQTHICSHSVSHFVFEKKSICFNHCLDKKLNDPLQCHLCFKYMDTFKNIFIGYYTSTRWGVDFSANVGLNGLHLFKRKITVIVYLPFPKSLR